MRMPAGGVAMAAVLMLLAGSPALAGETVTVVARTGDAVVLEEAEFGVEGKGFGPFFEEIDDRAPRPPEGGLPTFRIRFEELEEVLVDPTADKPFLLRPKRGTPLVVPSFLNSKLGVLRGKVGEAVRSFRMDDVRRVLFHRNTDEEFRDWAVAGSLDVPDRYEAFVAKYPASTHGNEARGRVQTLRRWIQADNWELERVLQSAAPSDRLRAVELQAQKGKARAVGPLVGALSSDKSWAVRVAAARSLGAIGAPEGARALAEVLGKAKMISFRTPGGREAEGGLEEPGSIDLRIAAAEALGAIASPEAVPALKARILEDRNYKLKLACLAALKAVAPAPGGGAPCAEAAAAAYRSFDPEKVTVKTNPWWWKLRKAEYQQIRDGAIASIEAIPKGPIPGAAAWGEGEGSDERLKKALEGFR